MVDNVAADNEDRATLQQDSATVQTKVGTSDGCERQAIWFPPFSMQHTVTCDIEIESLLKKAHEDPCAGFPNRVALHFLVRTARQTVVSVPRTSVLGRPCWFSREMSQRKKQSRDGYAHFSYSANAMPKLPGNNVQSP